MSQMTEDEARTPIPLSENKLSPEEERAQIESVLTKNKNYVGMWCVFVPPQWWMDWVGYTKFDDFLLPSGDKKKIEMEKEYPRPGDIDMTGITKEDEEVKGGVVLQTGFSKDHIPLVYPAWQKIASWYKVVGLVYCAPVISVTLGGSPKCDDKTHIKAYRIGANNSADLCTTIAVWKTEKVKVCKQLICKQLHLSPEHVKLFKFSDPKDVKGPECGDEKSLSDCGLSSIDSSVLLEDDTEECSSSTGTGNDQHETNDSKKNEHRDVAKATPSSLSEAATTTTTTSSSYKEYPYSYSSYSYMSKMAQPGQCGLSNLGNTCFMNSALQCLSHTDGLRDFMLSDRWENDINMENPLGTKGKLTRAFAEVVHNIWEGSSSSFSPSEFKRRISEVATQFEGYRQHDSQELMLFLLDGIHEDLNRIKKKPYIPEPDYEGQPDEQWAKECWDRYKMRNDSVIVDWFQGQLKYKLVCPDCRTESLKFDPFTFVSVPIPQKMVRVKCNLVTNDMNKQHFSITLDMRKTDRVLDLCRSVESLPCMAGVNPPVAWNKICVRECRNGIPTVNYDRECVSYLERKDIQLYMLTGVSGSRDVFAFIAVPGARDDRIIGQSFLLPLVDGLNYFNLCLTIFQRIASAVDVEALRKFIEPIVEKRTKEYRERHNSNDGEEGEEKDESGEPKPKAQSPDDDFYPDERDWGEEIFPGIPNRNLLIAVDSIFSVSVTNSTSDRRKIEVQKKNGLELAIPLWQHVVYVKILLTREAAEANIYSEEVLSKNRTVFSRCMDEGVTDGRITLDKCLDLFNSSETLGDDDQYRCRKCKDLRKASRQSFFWTIPPLLIIHLKRFSSTSGRISDKLDTFIDFPLKGLDMTKRVQSNTSGKPLIYDLYAVSNHSGYLGGGHYTAYATIGDKWYEFNDSSAFAVTTPESVVSPSAYVLFYKLRSWQSPKFEKLVKPVSSVVSGASPKADLPLVAVSNPDTTEQNKQQKQQDQNQQGQQQHQNEQQNKQQKQNQQRQHQQNDQNEQRLDNNEKNDDH